MSFKSKWNKYMQSQAVFHLYAYKVDLKKVTGTYA